MKEKRNLNFLCRFSALLIGFHFAFPNLSKVGFAFPACPSHRAPAVSCWDTAAAEEQEAQGVKGQMLICVTYTYPLPPASSPCSNLWA